jgi:hypothetical protein
MIHHHRYIRAWRAAAILSLACASSTALADFDEIISFDGFDGCEPVQASIGSEGGTLRLCGAQLSIPANAVTVATTFGIERVSAPPSAPFDMELAGPVFHFTPTDVTLQAPASVRVPRENGRRGGLSVDTGDGSLLMIEACRFSASGLQQFFRQLGTFGAVRYVGDLPENTQGLGDGIVETIVHGRTITYDLDAPGVNWAIYQDQPDGRRQVTVRAMLEHDGGQFEAVRFDLSVDAATNSGDITQISLLGMFNGSFIAGLLGSASITFGDLSDGRIRANVDATLVSGPTSLPFQATLDVGVERYIFPPELNCGKSPSG